MGIAGRFCSIRRAGTAPPCWIGLSGRDCNARISRACDLAHRQLSSADTRSYRATLYGFPFSSRSIEWYCKGINNNRAKQVDGRRSNSPIANPAGTRFPAVGIVCLCWLFLFSLALGASAAPDIRDSAISQPRINPSFAIADFDGDLRPDLVAVQTGTGDVVRTDYWIQLRLSSAGLQTILIVAPTGGLHVVARDVNGDHAPDLVITTTWLEQPVAVFLNDGHGAFSRVDPRAFPDAFAETQSDWSSATSAISEADCVPQDWRPDMVSNSAVFRPARSQSRFVACRELRLGTEPVLNSRLGRAPPLEFSRS